MPRKILHLNFNADLSTNPLTLARRFVANHQDALLNASHLLGGSPAYRRCQDLIRDLGEAPALTRRLRAELVALHRLLALDHVGEPDSIGAACFAEIVPDDPRVHDVCRLTDALYDLLVALAGQGGCLCRGRGLSRSQCRLSTQPAHRGPVLTAQHPVASHQEVIMQNDFYSISLEDLAARTIGVGREVATAIQASDLARNPHEMARVTRCLARLSRGEPLDPRDCGGFETIRNILVHEIAQETVGTVRVFHGVRDPDAGDIGTVVEHAVASDRGADLDAMLGEFERFLFMRQVLLDRMNAERMMAGMGQA